MDAVEFLKIERRICGENNCTSCPLNKEDTLYDRCKGFKVVEPENYVAIVEKWAKEHPVKTKKQKFLELFNADTPRKWHKDCEKTCNANVPCSFCLWWDEEYEELK